MIAHPDTTRADAHLRAHLRKAGLTIGHVGGEMSDMDRQALNALLDEAARTGKTLAGVLVASWAEKNRRARHVVS